MLDSCAAAVNLFRMTLHNANKPTTEEGWRVHYCAGYTGNCVATVNTLHGHILRMRELLKKQN
jgi:hypothetical protein